MLEHQYINLLVNVLLNVPVNSYGHVETVIDSVTLFPWQAKTKQLTVLSALSLLTNNIPP